MGKSKKVIILKNILFSLIITVVVLSLLELLLRGACFFNIMKLPREQTIRDLWAKDGWDVDRELNLVMIPNDRTKRGRAKATTNSYRLRDQEIPLEKPPGTYRILVLGDSTVFGFGITFNKTFPELLEVMLNENRNGTHYDVINAGVPGYSIYNAYVYLKRDGIRFDPDLIMLETNFNDRRYILSTEFEDGTDFYNRFYYRLRVRELLDNSFLWRWLRRVLKGLFGLIQADLLVTTEFDYKSINMDDLHCRVEPSRYKRILQKLIDFCRSRDIPVILIPLEDPPKYMNDYYGAQALAEEGLFEEALSMLLAIYNRKIPVYKIIEAKKINEIYEAMGMHDKKIREIESPLDWMSTDGNIPVYPSTPYIKIMQEMANDEDVFFIKFVPPSWMYLDYIHLNYQGHMALAENLFSMLKDSEGLNIQLSK